MAGPGLKHALGGRPCPMLSRIYWPALWLQAHSCFWQAPLCGEKATEIRNQGFEKSHRLETVCPCVGLDFPVQLKVSPHAIQAHFWKCSLIKAFKILCCTLVVKTTWTSLHKSFYCCKLKEHTGQNSIDEVRQILKRVICRNYVKAYMTTGSFLFSLCFFCKFSLVPNANTRLERGGERAWNKIESIKNIIFQVSRGTIKTV